MNFKQLLEELEGLEIGDELLMGKYRNKKAFIKEFGTDKNNQPTVITDKGERAVYGFRVRKFMEGPSAGEKYRAYFGGMLRKYGVGSPKKLTGKDKRKFWKELKTGWAAEKEKEKDAE